MPDITKSELQHWREVCGSATVRLTPAPWVAEHDDEGSTVLGVGRVVARLPYNRNPWDHDDAAFIALARTALPRALERIEELEREKEMRNIVARIEPKGMSYQDRSEFDRLKHADVAQGRRVAELERAAITARTRISTLERLCREACEIAGTLRAYAVDNLIARARLDELSARISAILAAVEGES